MALVQCLACGVRPEGTAIDTFRSDWTIYIDPSCSERDEQAIDRWVERQHKWGGKWELHADCGRDCVGGEVTFEGVCLSVQ